MPDRTGENVNFSVYFSIFDIRTCRKEDFLLLFQDYRTGKLKANGV